MYLLLSGEGGLLPCISILRLVWIEFQNNIWILNCNLMKNLDIACKIAKIEKIKVIEIVQNNKSKRIESIN